MFLNYLSQDSFRIQHNKASILFTLAQSDEFADCKLKPANSRQARKNLSLTQDHTQEILSYCQFFLIIIR